MFDLLTVLEETLAKLAADEGPVDLARISTAVEQLEFQRLRAVGEYDRSGAWAAENFVTPASGLRAKVRCSHAKSHRLVRSARKLEQLPETAAAFGAGEITGEHVDGILRPYTPERAAMLEGIEKELVVFARTHAPEELRVAIKTMTDAFDGDGGANDDEKQQKLNRVTLSTTTGGRGILNGSLDPEFTDLLQTALDAEMEVLRQKADPRTTPQLRADALRSMARWSLSARPESDARGRGRTNVNLVYDIGGLDISDPALAALARADTAHGQRLSRTTLETILCDCFISRVITNGRSTILDIGRQSRTISNALWTALVVRDGHCTEKGCTLGPGHCEAHHIVHWEHGGPTNLDNLVLLCWYHHKKRHIQDAKRGKRSAHFRTVSFRATHTPTGTTHRASAGSFDPNHDDYAAHRRQ